MKRILRLFTLVLCLMLFIPSAFALPKNYVVRYGDREVPKIAVTVDDCWDLEVVQKIHDLSVELNVPLTWFPVGVQYHDEDREMWQSIIDHGSELGNHSWKHPDLLAFGTGNVIVNVRLPQERLDEMLGYHYPLRLYRPPYGHYKNDEKSVLDILYGYNVEKVILWDVSQTDPQQAFKDTKNGSILLYHARNKDYECLKTLIPMLLDAGYELVTVSDLLGLEPLVLEIPGSTDAPAADPVV